MAVIVTVHMHGNLRRFMPGGADRRAMEIAEGTTAETILRALGAEKDTWLVAVNGVTAARDTILGPGDVLDCFEPVAAG
jgi:sulfur carrier protein ThiS